MTDNAASATMERPPGEIRLSIAFYFFSAALFVSRMGTLAVSFCLPWILAGKASPALISVISASVITPYILSPWLSKLPDRYDFRWLLLIFELIQAPGTISAYFLVMHHAFAILIVCLFVSGTAEALSGLITDFYLLPYIAPAGSLARANGIALSATQAAPLISPLIAGLLVAAHAAVFIFILNAVTYTFTSAMALVFVRRRAAPPRKPGVPTMSAFMKIMRSRPIRSFSLSLTFYNLATGAVLLLTILKAQQTWHLSASDIGVATTVAGIAGAAGAWISGRYQRQHFRAFRLGVTVCMAGTVAATAGSVLWINMAGLFVIYIAEGPVAVAQQTIRQSTIPPSIYGAVNGCLRAVMIAAVPAARLLLGGMTTIMSLAMAGIPLAMVAVLAVITAFRCTEAATLT